MSTLTTATAPSHDDVERPPAPRYVETSDDLCIATYERGDLDAPPVVLLHGVASSAEQDWFATGRATALLRAGYRVVAMDWRGHGRSDEGRAGDDTPMAQLVADVETVLDAYLLDDVRIIGIGLGDAVARAVVDRHAHRVAEAPAIAALAAIGFPA